MDRIQVLWPLSHVTNGMEGLLKCPLPIVRCLLMVLQVDETKGHDVDRGRLYYRVQTQCKPGVPVLWLSTLPIGGEVGGRANGGI